MNIIDVVKIVPTVNLTTTAVSYTTGFSTAAMQIIKRAIFSNPSTAAAAITANIVPSTGSSTLANQIINARSLAIGETYVSPELSGMVLKPTDRIYASCSLSSAVNFTVSGLQVS